MLRSPRLSALWLAACLLILVWLRQPAAAASVPIPVPVPASPSTPAWTALPGRAVDLSVGQDAAAFALAPDGRLWLRRARQADALGHWRALPGRYRRVDACSERVAWAVDESSGVRRLVGSAWRRVGTVLAQDVACTGADEAHAVDADGHLLRARAPDWAFVPVDGAPKALTRVDTDAARRPWVVDQTGALWQWTGRAWLRHSPAHPVKAAPEDSPDTLDTEDVSTGPTDSVMSLSRGGVVRQRAPGDRPQPAWSWVASRARAMASGADGGAWVAAADGGIHAQRPDPLDVGAPLAPPDVFTQVLAWRRVPGRASALAVSARGQVLALGDDGQVWRWRGRQGWSGLPGRFTRIAVSPEGEPWALDADGRLYRHSAQRWRPWPGRALGLAWGGPSGNSGTSGTSGTATLWTVRPDGQLLRWRGAQGEGAVVPVPPTVDLTAVRSLAVGPDGRAWLVDATGLVWRQGPTDTGPWQPLPGVVADALALGPGGSAFVTTGGAIRRFDPLRPPGQGWVPVAGTAVAIAVGPRDMPWIVGPRQEIFASAWFDEPLPPPVPADARAASPTTSPLLTTAAPPAGRSALATARAVQDGLSPASFRLLPQVAARDIAIGADGSVFALAFDGSVIRWSNAQQRFLAFAGQFSRLAVSPQGRPWGVTTRGEVWRHDGQDWRRVPNFTAQDIDIGADGTVLAAATDDSLHRFDPAQERFERLAAAQEEGLPPTGRRVAAGPQGQAWTVDAEQRVRRCDASGCMLLPQRATDIDIGPEGSVFIATPARRLRRWLPATGDWVEVPVDTEALSVGPGGLPWLVGSQGEVRYAALFARDESRDLQQAARTAATVSAAGPVFSFQLNMPFDTVALPAGLGVNGFNMAEHPSGKLVVMDKVNGFWTHDPQARTWQFDASVPPVASLLGADRSRSFVITPDGSYWLSNSGAPPNSPQVWRRAPGGTWRTVPGLQDGPDCDAGSPPPSNSLSLTPDGSLMATSRGCNLYRYDPTLQRFMPVTLPPRPPGGAGFLAVDARGHLWVGTHASQIFEYTGDAWVQRSQGTRVFAIWQCLHWELPCAATGANGTVYTTDEQAARRLTRWNPNGGSWDTVITAPPFTVHFLIARDGHPWVWDGTALYRAR